MSIKQSIENFGKFHDVLNGFYDSRTLDVERLCVNKIISYKQEQKDFYKISIKEQKLAKYVLDSFGDEN